MSLDLSRRFLVSVCELICTTQTPLLAAQGIEFGGGKRFDVQGVIESQAQSGSNQEAASPRDVRAVSYKLQNHENFKTLQTPETQICLSRVFQSIHSSQVTRTPIWQAPYGLRSDFTFTGAALQLPPVTLPLPPFGAAVAVVQSFH